MSVRALSLYNIRHRLERECVRALSLYNIRHRSECECACVILVQYKTQVRM